MMPNLLTRRSLAWIFAVCALLGMVAFLQLIRPPMPPGAAAEASAGLETEAAPSTDLRPISAASDFDHCLDGGETQPAEQPNASPAAAATDAPAYFRMPAGAPERWPVYTGQAETEPGGLRYQLRYPPGWTVTGQGASVQITNFPPSETGRGGLEPGMIKIDLLVQRCQPPGQGCPSPAPGEPTVTEESEAGLMTVWSARWYGQQHLLLVAAYTPGASADNPGLIELMHTLAASVSMEEWTAP